MNEMRVVALGGGHGLSATLTALRCSGLAADITAVVTVADDGGSSGRIRAELGALPPGDLRRALAALCPGDAGNRLLDELIEYRFGGQGPLAGHSVINLLLTAMTDIIGDPVFALDALGRILGARGRVLPMSRVGLEISAEVVAADGTSSRIVGQANVARAVGTVRKVWLDPPDAPACAEALIAVAEADWVILGPGSWYTSVLPHLMLPELAAALHRTKARRLVILNLVPEEETKGFEPATYLRVLGSYAPEFRIDIVLANGGPATDLLAWQDEQHAGGGTVGLVTADVADPQGRPKHDVRRLAVQLSRILSGSVGSPTGR